MLKIFEILWVTFLILFGNAEVAKGDVLSLDHMSIDSWRTLTRRDPFQPDNTGHWTRGAQFNFDLRFMEYFAWKNRVHMDGTQAQLRNAGWEFEVVLDKCQFQPFYYHHSQHAFDSNGVGKYPLIDRYGVRFTFFNKNKN